MGIALLSACGGDEPGVTVDDNNNITPPVVPDGTTETEAANDDPRQAILDMWSYPDVDFEGYDFRIMIRGQRDDWDSQDIVAEELTGAVVNDSVFNRNVEVEEALGISITGVWVPEYSMRDRLRLSVAAGDGSFDAVMMNFEGLSGAMQQGHLVNLDGLDGIDLSFPWWDQSLLREMSIMNRHYFATGDITIMTNDGTWTMMFNKQLAQEFELPNLYDIVRAGEWTGDKMLELGRGVSASLDGSGNIGHLDRVAFATTIDSVQGLFFSMGNRITRKDVLDLPTFALYGDHLMRSLDLMFEIMRGEPDFTMLSGD